MGEAFEDPLLGSCNADSGIHHLETYRGSPFRIRPARLDIHLDVASSVNLIAYR